MASILGLFFRIQIFVLCAQSASRVSVDLDHKTGEYQLLADGETWLVSEDPFFHVNGKLYQTEDGTLKLASSVLQERGRDELGDYEETIMVYLPQTNSSQHLQVRFRHYGDRPFILFGHAFHGGDFEGTSIGDANDITSGFPRFKVDAKRDLGYLAYGGIMTGNTAKSIGRWHSDKIYIASGLDSGPLVLFQMNSAMVISPFNHFMATSAVYKEDDKERVASWGLMGNIERVPDHTHVWTIAYYSEHGINAAMDGWGETLRMYYGKDEKYLETDFTSSYLGYWTDNGAYYYYNTEPSKTYEDTLFDVVQYAKESKIPYRYLQYDAWFYSKMRSPGTMEWYATPDVFPDGMQYVYNKTGFPALGHNRCWSPKTPYAKQNGGKYNFVIDNENAIPADKDFWDDLLRESKKWGLVLYEQDFLNIPYNTMKPLQSDIFLGRDWLRQIGDGARKNNMNIQFCMAPSRHILQTLEIPSVTQTRVSGDYHPTTGNWKIGISSIFAHAMRIAPFKDNFWTTQTQTGNPYGTDAVEKYPKLQSLVATLSTGPVGPSDKIGYSDVELIMKSCNAEGLLLKPERPARAVNDQIIEMSAGNFSGEVWSTYTDISGFKFGIVFGANFGENDKMSLTPYNAGFEYMGPLPPSVVFSAKTQDTPFSRSKPLVLSGCGLDDFCLFYISPVLIVGGKELIIYGEMNKWVPLSKQRVKSIALMGDPQRPEDIKIKLEGVEGEVVNFFVKWGGENIEFQCEFYGGGSRMINLLMRNCEYN